MSLARGAARRGEENRLLKRCEVPPYQQYRA
jgi:hypothetical protein